MVRSCLVSCCSGWNVAWGSAGCAADEEPAAAEGAFDNELYFTETGYPRMLNSGEVNILYMLKIIGIWVVFYVVS